MILLISIDNDIVTDEICRWLIYLNKKFVRLNENYSITNIYFDLNKNIYKIFIDNQEYDLNSFKSIFYRNGDVNFEKQYSELDSPLHGFYNSEYESIKNFLKIYLDKNKIRIYGNLLNTEVNKLDVLYTAKQIGLKIPETYIFTSIEDMFDIDLSKKYITKSISEMLPIFYQNDLYLNYTRDINLENLTIEKKIFIPTKVQSKINKNFEIRVFFFENKIWSIATFEFTKNADVRNIKASEKKYIPYVLPKHISEKVILLKNKLGLKCGTIDFLKTDKEFYFLEINPLGQFYEVSYYGNYKIEKYIAELL